MKEISERRLRKFKDVIAKRHHGFVLVLEDVHDPHNAAAILRTCDGFGIPKVFFIFEKEKYYNPKRIGKSSSSSANKWLDFEIFRSTEECLEKLKKDKYTIVSTSLTENSENLFETKLIDEKLALVVGNERSGVSEEVIKLSDKVIKLPMNGMVQSLNVSVTTGIFVFEIIRQRARSGRNFLLNEEERKKLLENFLLR